jgi:hypothetical protein
MATLQRTDPTALDAILTAQLAVAWAGEKGEEPRLGWWRTDMVAEFGGHDLLQRLLPHTWEWAALQAVREAARRRDAELRAKASNPDRIVSLFRLGFEVDEQVEERLLELKRSGRTPAEVLPGLQQILREEWDADAFNAWVGSHGSANTTTTPIGRRLKGKPPEGADQLATHLVAALAPLASEYPLPHYEAAP